MNEELRENICDGGIENGFILAGRRWKSDPVREVRFSANGCFASPARTQSFGKRWPIPISLILAVAFEGAQPRGVGDCSSCAAGRTQRLYEHISGGNQS